MDRYKRNKHLFIHKLCQKNFKFIITTIFIILIFTHCSTYLNHRKNDSLDIFTFELHDKIYGFTTRISFLQLGFLYQDEEGTTIGIKNGITGNLDHQNFSFLFLGSERFKGRKFKENQAYEKQIKTIQDSNQQENIISEELLQYYQQKKEIEKQNIEFLKRNKFYDVYLPFGTKESLRKSHLFLKRKGKFAQAPFYTEVKLQLGIYYGITMSFNLGEFLDFLIGIFNIDILNDDR